MGRIKTKKVKRITNELFRKYKDEFKESFDENKKIITKLADINSKKLRNVIAGYVTRLMRVKEIL